MQSALVYGVMFILSVWFANIAQKTNNKLYVAGIIFLLSAVCGCRAISVGNDTKSYYNICIFILNSSSISDAELEKGFECLCRILLAIDPNPHFVFFVVASITYALVISRLWELRDIADFDWSVAGFIISFFTFTLSGIRQGLALAVVFWATRYLFNKKYASYIFFVLIASTLHNTAIIACANLLWEIRLWKYLKKSNRIILISFLIVIPIAILYLIQRYFIGKYDREITAAVEIGMLKIIELGFGILALIAYEFDCKMEKKRGLKSNSYGSITTKQTLSTIKLYYFIGVIVNATGYISSTFGRAGLYWYWFEPVLMGMLVKSKVNQRIFKFAIFIFYGYLCYANCKLNGYNQIPYQFFWQTAN